MLPAATSPPAPQPGTHIRSVDPRQIHRQIRQKPTGMYSDRSEQAQGHNNIATPMLKVVEQCCEKTGSKPTSAMVRNCSREMGPWMSSASSTFPAPAASSESCMSLDKGGTSQPLHASIDCLPPCGAWFSPLLATCRHAQQSLLEVFHSNPARTHGTPIHLLAEAAHGVAELADVQRAAQVRICRTQDVIALHSSL